jgi:hypothetical protein
MFGTRMKRSRITIKSAVGTLLATDVIGDLFDLIIILALLGWAGVGSNNL